MHDDADFLRAILADPFDDAPRLIYADWLEENVGSIQCPACRGNKQYSYRVDGGGMRFRNPCDECHGTGRTPDQRAKRAELIRLRANHGDGFFDSISCPLAVFMLHAAKIFARHPVTEVRLTDREPQATAGGYIWNQLLIMDRHDTVPSDLLHCLIGNRDKTKVYWLPYYPTVNAAHAALSRACVDYGRSLAGLPPMAWPAMAENELSGISG